MPGTLKTGTTKVSVYLCSVPHQVVSAGVIDSIVDWGDHGVTYGDEDEQGLEEDKITRL